MSGWLDSATKAIEEGGRYWTQRNAYSSGTVRVRTNSSVTTHYTGLTKSAAKTYVAEHHTDAGVTDMRWERDGEGGAYRVVAEIITWGEWADET